MRRRWLTLLTVTVIAVLVSAEPAWAWGPGMHILVGTEILGALSLLPAAVAGLLRRYPYDYLYGCIAADITFGKKYAPVDKHCHHWHVGEELLDAADTESTRACALGYLTHLAGDTVAHNFFLPRRLLATSNTQAIGHSYWEHRIDIHLGQAYLAAARHLVMEFNHSHNDELIDRVLARAVFSFQTNQRIFRGMIRLADHDTWQAVFDRLLEHSRWDVTDAEVIDWLRRTFDYSTDYLVARSESLAATLDPTGEEALQTAKRLARVVGQRKARRQEDLERLAVERFPIPADSPSWWDERLRAEGLSMNLTHLSAKPLKVKRQGRQRAGLLRSKTAGTTGRR